MKRTSLSLAAGIATAVMLVSAPAAQAAVSAKDVPSQADITKAFPELAGGTFSTDKTKQVAVPPKSCGGTAGLQKAKSGSTTTGVSTTGTSVVVAGVAEVKSAAQAKSYLAAYKKYVKKCGTFTEPTTGATVTAKLGKSFKLGDSSLTVVQETTFSGVVSYSTSVLTIVGKRLGTIAVVDDAPVATSSVKKLAKVAAKKMK
ncbi:hypothetical protein SAMN04489844_2718 [Nocardioides exalbidus]|uniref:PknH-like extracellular domain-containing protein n=1 Tax=Nocardioides exalbidus TaxID=402596 RepID=A0A1H4UBV4_9ACTN|nr:hypothetical protein [Nocardioides exalbidus]SEC65704.1 hypothetical protein SAMN04489844_2718 [Nocardioides exalbidus]